MVFDYEAADEVADVGCAAVVVVVDELEGEGGVQVADVQATVAVGVLDPRSGALEGLGALGLELAGEGGGDAYADGGGVRCYRESLAMASRLPNVKLFQDALNNKGNRGGHSSRANH